MTIEQSLIGFLAAASILTVTPGVDTALVLRTATVENAKSAIGASLGISIGLLLWGSAVSLGLGGLMAASEVVYNTLKWVGAAYLFYLGFKLLFKPRKEWQQPEKSEDDTAATQKGAGAWLVKGLLTNLLNPKVGVFYATFLPQFVPAQVSVTGWSLLLAAMHVFITALWFAALIAAAIPLGRFLRRPGILGLFDRLTGGVFVAAGVKLILSKNPS